MRVSRLIFKVDCALLDCSHTGLKANHSSGVQGEGFGFRARAYKQAERIPYPKMRVSGVELGFISKERGFHTHTLRRACTILVQFMVELALPAYYRPEAFNGIDLGFTYDFLITGPDTSLQACISL